MHRALCVVVGVLILLGFASEATPTPRRYVLLDERVSNLKNFSESAQRAAVSSTYLLGQGKEDWEKEMLTVENPFGDAASVSEDLQKFSVRDELEDAELLKQYRLDALAPVLSFANFTSHVAKNFYRRIGRIRDCGLYPENVLQGAVAPPLDETLDALARRFELMLRSVIDGTF
ncbi:hypothetical protein AAVH_30593, partial [Aphelenchoides avenae]